MPWIIPIKRSTFSSKRWSKYKSLEETTYCQLQKRKKPASKSKKHRPTFRIVTQGSSFYEVAYSDSLEELQNTEWKYCLHNLPMLVPKELTNSQLQKWLVAHFTQLGVETYGALQDDEKRRFPATPAAATKLADESDDMLDESDVLNSTRSQFVVDSDDQSNVSHGESAEALLPPSLPATNRSHPGSDDAGSNANSASNSPQARSKTQRPDFADPADDSKAHNGLCNDAHTAQNTTHADSQSASDTQIDSHSQQLTPRSPTAAAGPGVNTPPDTNGYVIRTDGPPGETASQGDDKNSGLGRRHNTTSPSRPTHRPSSANARLHPPQYGLQQQQAQAQAQAQPNQSVVSDKETDIAMKAITSRAMHIPGSRLLMLFVFMLNFSILIVRYSSYESTWLVTIFLNSLLYFVYHSFWTGKVVALTTLDETEFEQLNLAAERIMYQRRSASKTAAASRRSVVQNQNSHAQFQPQPSQAIVYNDSKQSISGSQSQIDLTDTAHGGSGSVGNAHGSAMHRRTASAAPGLPSIPQSPADLLSSRSISCDKPTSLADSDGDGGASAEVGHSDSKMRDSSHKHAAAPGTMSSMDLLDHQAPAGSLQLSMDPSVRHCWRPVDATTMNVRIGPDYARNGKKAPSLPAMMDCLAMDIMSSPQKISRVTEYIRFRDIHKLKSWGNIPPLVVVNMQFPNYPPANPLWGKKRFDGLSVGVAFWLTLNDDGIDALENGTPAGRLLERFINELDNETLTDQLKGLGRIANTDEIALPRLIAGYNGKPFLTRPQHTFFRSRANQDVEYVEMLLDVHNYNYLSRKAFYTYFLDQTERYVCDFGLVIEGRNDDELPEQMMFAIQLAYPNLKTGDSLMIDTN
jgi:Protein ENHANCED DISEASE RESISTANCE 2, C-terminal